LYRDKYLSLEEKSNCSEKVLADLKTLYKMTNEKLIFTTSLLDEKDEQVNVLDEENKKLTKKLSDLHENRRQDSLGSKVVEARNVDFQQKLEEEKRSNEQKDKEIEELKIKLQKKEEFADSMANKLVNMKTQMDLINLTMKKYSCKRINKLVGKSDVDIILQKNPSSKEFILDIVYNGKHEHYLLSTISNVYNDKINPMLFHIEFAVNFIRSY
jgi:predicted RNase H-like nuclease (RuvC/YqgF family)